MIFFRIPKPITLLCLMLLAAKPGLSQGKNDLQTDIAISPEDLASGFQNPPPESRLRCYWWWLNGMATEESITRDLEQMKAKGYGGASIVDAGSSNYEVAHKTPAGAVFMSPRWMELYQHAIREASRLGIELSVNLGSGWNPGGPSITPEMALKKLVYTETPVKGGQLVDTELPRPDTNLLYRDVCVQAIPMPTAGTPVRDSAIRFWSQKTFNRTLGWQGVYPLWELRAGYHDPVRGSIVHKKDIVDLTGRFDGSRLKWDVPEGDWLVIRYGYTCTGARTSTNSDGWSGLSVDHLDPDAFELFRETVIQPLIDAARAAGNSLRFLQTDSWEMGAVNWTARFPDYFRHFRGYDIVPYLPILAGHVVEGMDESNRFLEDYRKTVGDCVAENHYQLLADVAHRNGLGIHPESGGPHSAPVDALRVMAISDFPQGEFWARSNTHRVTDAARLAVKQSACVAHTNGKRFVAAEGPTSIGPQWERSPKELKANIDRIFCSGVNRIVWHTFSSSPPEFGRPGNEYFAGTHLNPNVTWWKEARDFISYLDRCSFMLQQGLFVADVLYYYGDDVPNFVFLKEEYPELHFGYEWDKCSRDVILNRISMANGKIVLPDGMTYRLLVLAPEKNIDLAVLRKLAELVEAGLTVIGPAPLETSSLAGYPDADRELASLVGKLWGNIDGKTVTEHRFGKGRVIWGQDVNDVLSKLGAGPDFAFTSPDTATRLDYIHRQTRSSDVYFVVNRYSRKGIDDFKYRYLTGLPNRFEQVECRFRVTGKVPQLWDPVTGAMEPVRVYDEQNGYTRIPLHLNPEGSVFVVFTEGKAEDHFVQVKRDGESLFPANRQVAGEFSLFSFTRGPDGQNLSVAGPGHYTLTTSNGKILRVEASGTDRILPVNGPWKVSFDPAAGGPVEMVFDTLKSWTEFADERIRYYSGSAHYEKTIRINRKDGDGSRILLDLGNLQELATVTLNGHRFNLCWEPPYRLDVTDWLKTGDNRLEVEVTNLWPNRLIGDAKLPPGKRLTRTNIVKFDAPGSESLLRVSGLLGPVRLVFRKDYPIR